MSHAWYIDPSQFKSETKPFLIFKHDDTPGVQKTLTRLKSYTNSRQMSVF